MKTIKDSCDPYEILKGLYRKETHSSFDSVLMPEQSERFEEIFAHMGDTSRQWVKFSYLGGNMVNAYDFVAPIDQGKKTVVLLAHWDVNNTVRGTDNVVDNTGSVSILLALANRLRTRKEPLPVNVAIAIVDGEEKASVMDGGARKLAEDILSGRFGPEVDTINLEVSCHGRVLFTDSSDGRYLGDQRFLQTTTPYNDSYALNHRGIKSSCIGIITEEDKAMVEKTGYCRTWGACHNDHDKFEMADAGDMDWFVSKLEELVLEV